MGLFSNTYGCLEMWLDHVHAFRIYRKCHFPCFCIIVISIPDIGLAITGDHRLMIFTFPRHQYADFLFNEFQRLMGLHIQKVHLFTTDYVGSACLEGKEYTLFASVAAHCVTPESHHLALVELS